MKKWTYEQKLGTTIYTAIALSILWFDIFLKKDHLLYETTNLNEDNIKSDLNRIKKEIHYHHVALEGMALESKEDYYNTVVHGEYLPVFRPFIKSLTPLIQKDIRKKNLEEIKKAEKKILSIKEINF